MDNKNSESNSDKSCLGPISVQSSAESIEKDKKDGNTCIALGLTVGTLGAASAAFAGALCPICVLVAPGLIGVGAYRRWRASHPPKN